MSAAASSRDAGTVPAAELRFNPFGADFRHDPYPHYARLRATRPVHRALGMWVLTRHADVREVLGDRSFSAGIVPRLVDRQAERLTTDRADAVARIRRLGRTSLVFTDDPEHARLRGLVNRVFTAAEIARLRPRVAEAVDRLLATAWADGGADLVPAFAAPLPVAVIADWMGLPAGLRQDLAAWTHDIRFLLEPGLMRAGDLTRVCAVVETFATTLDEFVAQRRERPGTDLISRLFEARTGGGDRLTDEEVVFVCIMCFVAGNATTTALVGNGLLALLQHPEQADRLRARPDLAPSAVGEILRYDSPLQLTKRVATRDGATGGAWVREGDQVLLCLGAANRDPAMFPRPDAFDIGRDARGHLAFGHGMHGCLGAGLARLQAEVALEHLYRRPGRLELLEEQPRRQEHSAVLRSLESLPVAVRDAR